MRPILIAEDERPIADLIELTLTGAGYACEQANDGGTAADLIAEHDYELAVLDIMLPGIDGYELLGYLRSTGTPVIFVTARTSLQDRVRGLNLGADDYLTKPFEPLELVARVESVLRRAGRAYICKSEFFYHVSHSFCIIYTVSVKNRNHPVLSVGIQIQRLFQPGHQCLKRFLASSHRSV